MRNAKTANVRFGRIAPTVDDATALHDLCVNAGAGIVMGLKDAEYGLRGFVFADPDGNRIDVGQCI